MGAWKLTVILASAASIGSLLAPGQVSAEVVTWINRGVIDEVAAQLPPAFAGVKVGDEFELRVSFDTAAALWTTLPFPPGSLHVYDYSSIVMSLKVGAIGPIDFTPTSPGSGNPYYGNVLYARDDSGDIVASDYPPVMDGYSFGAEYAPGEGIAVVFRGDVLDLVNGTALPTTPDRRLTDLRDAFLAVRRFDASGADPFFVETHFLGRVRSVEAAPGTAPVITPSITGLLGNNGWYVGDVQLDWTVSDEQSAVASTTGCEAVNVASDTAGATYTCSATSAGGTGSATMTIRRDATPPAATATAVPQANKYGWRRTTVRVTFTGTDAMSGGVTCDPPVLLASEGIDQSASGRCYDAAGNQSALASVGGINIDKTLPTVRFEFDIPSRSGYAYCSDALSGVATCKSVASKGGKWTVVATDRAGNQKKATATLPW